MNGNSNEGDDNNSGRIMSCARCQELRSRVDIRRPSDLTRVIQVVQANLNDGTLDEIENVNPLTGAPFLTLEPRGPWNDILSYDFRCRSCGAAFHLAVETYHGSGGAWAPVEE